MWFRLQELWIQHCLSLTVLGLDDKMLSQNLTNELNCLSVCLSLSTVCPAEAAVRPGRVLVSFCCRSLLPSRRGLQFSLGSSIHYWQPLHPLHCCRLPQTQRRSVACLSAQLSAQLSVCLSAVCLLSVCLSAQLSAVCLLSCLSHDADVSGRGPSLVVHTSVPFGLKHLEKDKEEVQPIILQELHKLLPDLPQPISIKCQKWRYSQVSSDRF